FPELRTVAAMAEAMRPRSPVEEGSPFELISPSDRIRLPSGLEDAYPLARTQSGVIFHCQFDASTSMYRDLFMVRLEGPLVPALLERSLRAAVERHPMLRTTFDLESYTEPLQLVWRRAEVALVVEDLPVPGPGSLTENSFPEPWMRQEIARPLDWSRAPLPRFFALWVPGGAFWFAASFFDALFDGWSAASLASEVLADYDHLLAGEAPPERRPPAGGYRRFIAAERQALGSAQEREFWRECLEGVGSGALPGFEEPSARGAGGEEAVRIVEVEVEAPLAAALEDAARKAGAELKQLLLAAHLASLSAFCGLRELTTGLEVHCRPDIAGADGILGMHMNILPFPMEIGVGSRRGWLRAVAEQERRWLRHRRFPFAEMARGRREAPKVETVFNFTHFHVLASLGSLLRLEAREAFGFNRTSFSLRADFNRHPLTGRLGLSLSARTEALSRARHRRLASIYRSCLEAWALRPEGDCRDFPTLPESERHQVLLEWGHAGASAAPPRLLPQAFRLQAARTPERTALEAAGETLSYGELKRRVEELAFRLRQASTADSEVVGIFAARSVAYVTAALAVAMAGKALLPLSVREPSHRLEEKVLQAGVRTVLVSGEARLPGSLAALAVPISEGAEGGRIVPSELLPTPPAESPAYLMFTSGSTGRPKAVVVSHGALGGFFSAMVQALGVAEGERWLAMSETTFDISLLELFLPLLTGGTVVLSPPEATLEPQDLLDQVADRRLRTIQATPAVWQTLLDAGWTGWSGLRVLCGGETLAEELASRLRHGGSEVWNLYGPTEATVWATARRLREEETVSLGAPLPGVAAYVLDPHLRLLGEGVPGELFLSGRGLAQGYGGDPRANATAFLPDPFSRLPGARLYRTGDRCQWSPEGRLLFLGRLDSQVKIRGIRVEPAEVEAALLACDDVHRALVLVEETAPGHRGLLAYVEPRIGVATTEQALRRFLGGRLPSFLIPSRIFVVPSWPLTRHGKVDRRRLPKPRSPRPTEETLESLVDFLEEMTEEEARALAEPGAE
ncbi:MAG: amino acid adenylation domain-containing protein, partial [Acidobacteria bacterium]|nr:amino acid adenylation domain-containing protein [Acidobacteriota bacterium]